MNIAIIPARGGSKRIPRKNIRPFAGRPMISYAINRAKSSGLFKHVVVSTDDPEIKAVAKNYGAETPFIRPQELADDHTPTVPVIAHAISECESLTWESEYICCIYPAVPFLQETDLVAALKLLQECSTADYSFPITEYPSAIQRALRLNLEKKTSSFNSEHEFTRTQDLEPAYHDTELKELVFFSKFRRKAR